MMKAMPRMNNDVYALRILMRSKIVAKKLVRGTQTWLHVMVLGMLQGVVLNLPRCKDPKA